VGFWLPEILAQKVAAFDRRLYEWRPRLSRPLHRVMVVTGIVAIASLLAEYGFYLEGSWARVPDVLTVLVVWLFVVNNIAQLAIAADRREHIRQRRFDFVVLGLLLLGYLVTLPLVGAELLRHVASWLLGAQPETPRITRAYVALTQGYIFLDLVLRGIRYSNWVLQRRFRPVNAVVISFLAVIGLGAVLLMLPRATAGPGVMPPIDALFTSASAVCVTGLIVVDTATDLTWLGQTIVLVLIQIGGLGLMTLTMFFVVFAESSASLRQYAYMRDVLNDATLYSARRTLRAIILFTVVIEAVGAILLYIFLPEAAIRARPRWYYALFHSVSGFCNAGFSLWTDNLAGEALRFSVPVNLTVMALIVLGGLGFSVLYHMWQKGIGLFTGKRVRISLHTRLVLVVTAVLIVFGTLGYLVLEAGRTLAGLTVGQRLLASLFQAVTPRTAGFNTLDTSRMGVPAALMTVFLMAIGASPGGTGGGVKTVTVGVAFLSAAATSTGRRAIEVLRRRIPDETVNRAMTVLLFAAVLISTSFFALSVVEPQKDAVRLLFEEVSAFGTVGLSMGITAAMSAAGKVILIVSMFFGRVGPLTIAIALAQRTARAKFAYPEEDVMVM
jgi:potassium uptake TrkH family protein